MKFRMLNQGFMVSRFFIMKGSGDRGSVKSSLRFIKMGRIVVANTFKVLRKQ